MEELDKQWAPAHQGLPACKKYELHLVHHKVSRWRNEEVVVPLPHALCLVLERYLTSARPVLVLKSPNPCRKLFVGDDGRPLDRNALLDLWKDTQRTGRAAWEPITVQQTRTVFAEHAVEDMGSILASNEGALARGAARIMGNTVRTWPNHYVRSRAQAVQEMARALDRIQEWRLRCLPRLEAELETEPGTEIGTQTNGGTGAYSPLPEMGRARKRKALRGGPASRAARLLSAVAVEEEDEMLSDDKGQSGRVVDRRIEAENVGVESEQEEMAGFGDMRAAGIQGPTADRSPPAIAAGHGWGTIGSFVTRVFGWSR